MQMQHVYTKRWIPYRLKRKFLRASPRWIYAMELSRCGEADLDKSIKAFHERDGSDMRVTVDCHPRAGPLLMAQSYSNFPLRQVSAGN